MRIQRDKLYIWHRISITGSVLKFELFFAAMQTMYNQGERTSSALPLTGR